MSKTSHDAEILAGIPSGVWADYWATEQEEKGRSFGGGVNLIDVAPNPPKWAKDWAKRVADKIVELNNNKSLEQIYEMAKKIGYKNDKEHFGYDLGMQTVGHGVSWTDDVPFQRLDELRKKTGREDLFAIPSIDFYR